MQVGGSGSIKSDINVTPLVDVVLVLLIIFMVITPVVQMGYLVRVPPKAPANLPPAAVQDQIILRFMPEQRMFINKDEITALQVLYSQPYAQRLTFADIKELATAISRPPRSWTADHEVPRHGPYQRGEEHRHHRRGGAVASRAGE